MDKNLANCKTSDENWRKEKEGNVYMWTIEQKLIQGMEF